MQAAFSGPVGKRRMSAASSVDDNPEDLTLLKWDRYKLAQQQHPMKDYHI